jgi:DNA-binding NarL/FixJ family response regulator
MTTVLICDDFRPIREGLRRNVAAVPGVDRVETVDTAEELFSRYPLERPDLVLMSLHLSGTGASEATRRLVREHPEANVVVMAQGDDRDSVVQAIAGGARGFLQRDVSREELCAAVAHALAGADLFAGIPAPRTVRELAPEGAPDLTERELQVLRGMSEGKSNGEIGRELYLSEDTVKTHARRLFRKLGVNDRAQAVALGFRRGLVH